MESNGTEGVMAIASAFRDIDSDSDEEDCNAGDWLIPHQQHATAGIRNGDLGSTEKPQHQVRSDFYPNPWVRRGDPDRVAGRSPSCQVRSGGGAGRCQTEPPGSSDPQDEMPELGKAGWPTAAVPVATVAFQQGTAAQLETLDAGKEASAGKNLSLVKILKINFIKYCQSTSLRGLPKIVKTKDRLLKYIWIVFTFAFFFGCFTCLALIINQYLNYDVIHQPRTVRNHAVQFPSFTVCNTRPLSQEGIEFIRSQNMMLPKEYYPYIMKASKNTHFNMRHQGATNAMVFNETIRDALSTIFDNKGYFENIPVGVDISNFGHTLDQTILICDSTILIQDFKRSKFCETIGTWTKTYDNKFLNCYTFTAGENYTKDILTVRIMAYTNERNLTHCPDCSSFPATQVSGLRVQLHNAGNYPEVQEEGLNIKPGSLTEIRFDTKQWIMKEEPHGRCSKTAPPSIRFSDSNFTYSYEACKKKVLHEKIMRACGCLDSTIPLPDSMLDTNLEYCGMIPPNQFSLYTNSSVVQALNSAERRRLVAEYYNISEKIVNLPSFINNEEFREFLRRITCNMEIFKVAGHETKSPCFTPCTYYTYATTISTTNWPTKAYLYEIVKDFKYLKQRIDDMYAKGIMGRNSSYLDPVYRRLRQVYDPAGGIGSMHRDDDYIQNNFIEILINRAKSANFEIERIEEKAVISLTSLLSQIGGLLSIWVGLTFVCIVEIVDMVYSIVTMYSQQSSGTRAAD